MKQYGRSISLCRVILFIILVVSATLPGRGETKVVERSAKKTPEWVLQKPADHLLVMGRGETLQDAQQEAERELLRQVVTGVAVNVRNEASMVSGKEGDKEWESFLESLSSRSAELPFLSDVTLAKCNDTYWERVLDKSSGKEVYRMYFLYPYSSVERGRLIDEYSAYDRNMENRLAELERDYESIFKYEDLAIAESELESLSGWFPDSHRGTRAEKLRGLYAGIRRSLQLLGDVVGKGECFVRVMRGSKPFSVPGRLEVTSNCASHIRVVPEDGGWRVSYNTDDCLEWEENSLKLTLRGTGLNLKGKVNF